MTRRNPDHRNPPRRPEDDLERWLPFLGRLALGRETGKPLRLSESELHELGRAVRELSRGFTGGRPLAGTPYLGRSASLAAYLLYFWPVSYMQARLVLSRLLPPGSVRGASVFDLGSGPGPLAAAAYDCGARRVLAVDSSRAALKAAGELARGRGRALETRVWDARRGEDLTGGPFKLILLGHVLNELWPDAPGAVELRAERLVRLARLLEDDGRIVILEPALLKTTRELLALRDRLAAQGFPVLAPCLRQGSCPCREEGAGPAAACHADYPWNPPPWLVRLAHRARLGKESLRFACLVLGKPGSGQAAPRDDRVFRVVSAPMLSKSGRLRYFICNETGRVTLSGKARGHEAWQAPFKRLRRYDVIKIEGTEERENGLGLGPESELEIISARTREIRP